MYIRTHLREGPLIRVKMNKMKTVEIYFFLFNDLLLVARSKAEKVFKLKERAVLSQCWISDSPIDSEKSK